MSVKHSPERNTRASGERRCTARSKQAGRQCARWASPGHRVCVLHGARSKRGAESGTYRHGERSKYVPKDQIPAIVQAAEAIERDLGRSVVVSNLAERRVRREELPDELDVRLRVDDSDRKDVEVLGKLEALRRAAEPTEAAPMITNVLDLGSYGRAIPCTDRGLHGVVWRLDVEGPTGSGTFIFDPATGAWLPARLTQDANGLEAWAPAVNALPANGGTP